MVQDHPAQILADTGAGLSIVSDSFISKYQIPTKPIKTRSIHGVTRHQLSINSSASMQVSIGTHNLGVVKASVADTVDYDLILGFTELWRLKPTIQWDTGCHGPGCSRSRRVMGSYGRSTGIEDLVDTSREHGRSAVSMETMDSYGLTCKGGPSTATRRTKLKEQAQPRGGPSSRSRHSHEEDQAQGACRWLPLRGSRDKSQRNCH
ncbi:uncharacterized protein UHO2_00965 [Ustilago hordei]|uniref:uncharacterized protein n=1 Tax=Ustilago hordei TaxID=120017 RepID=UPI001A6199AC|nr:uncharacterized protein UHO2_00965 [Ustilago hordei]SYW74100.1 uncharacterized protein UHO2_00965 [Ustilago hordei]